MILIIKQWSPCLLC